MKTLISKTFILYFFCLCITSCKSICYQVYDVDYDDNMKLQDSCIVYENEDCKVMYNLWSENGLVKFAIFNKTNSDIFVDMTQSIFSLNELANEYYKSRTWYKNISSCQTTITANTTGSGLWGNRMYLCNVDGVGVSSGISMKENEIECVPSKKYKLFGVYSVSPSLMNTHDYDKDYPTKTIQLSSYTRYNSPYIFTNRIVYGFSKDETVKKHIENEFWVSNITNYPEKEAVEYIKVEKTGYRVPSYAKIKRFKIGMPNKFYVVNKYERKTLLE